MHCRLPECNNQLTMMQEFDTLVCVHCMVRKKRIQMKKQDVIIEHEEKDND